MRFPESFIHNTTQIIGEDIDKLISALSENAPVSVRVNDKAGSVELFKGITTEQIRWCDNGFYLDKRPLFTADPLFHAGAYYVQEASSMFLSQIVKQFLVNCEIGIDLCAAPGGKSTLLKQFLPKDTLLISNEIIRTRAQILAENLIKWGESNFIVTNNDSKAFSELKSLFDFAVVDAPCSGEGMFRKDPNSISEWSEQNVEICVERQRDIIENIWPSIKQDGYLIYSTCTYNTKENEANIRWICEELGACILKADINAFPEITETPEGYRFYPHKTKGEGFFIAILKKTEENLQKVKIKSKLPKSTKTIHSDRLKFRLNKEDYVFIETENQIKAYQKKWLDHHIYLESQLNCFESGILIAEKKGKDIIPSHQLAMSKYIDRDNCDYLELNYEQAISFLKKESLILSAQKIGYLLVGYKGVPLGWVKNLGNRSNNLYPPQWKIKMNL